MAFEGEGSKMEAGSEVRGETAKLKILCLHGFRTSGSFLQKQISRWDPSIFAGFNLVFLDGIFPAAGKSDIEGIYPPPYFEWFQANKDFTEYQNLDKCISYLCEYITNHGPFHGLLGFSQGATLSALLLGYQSQGKILQQQPPMKLFISISGSKFRDPAICDVAYRDPIKVSSVHLIGEKDWLKQPGEDLAGAFHDPLVLRHPQGHTVPRLDVTALKQLSEWLRGILGGDAGGSVGEVEEGKVENGEAAANLVKIKGSENGYTGKQGAEQNMKIQAEVGH